ncbi:FG-GAP repeat domain-containing protein [Tundrisphaera sp. TA3]|uniref:FG-GAP repeat domain-containing protein n=1 Tax=Tundrisphaera sp. TA3 TaxID=3435775 RepID=UPI003EB9F891
MLRSLLALATLPCLMAAGPPLERIVIDDDFPAGYQVEVADVNGDGKPDIVGLGGGTCAWYENPTWRKRIVTGPDRTPDIISSATADIDGDGKAEIAIAYDFAMNEPKRGKLLLAVQGKGPDDPWEVGHIADVPSIHRLRWFDQLNVGPDSVRMTPVQPGRNPAPEHPGTIFRTRLIVAPLFGPSATPPTYAQEPAHVRFCGFEPYQPARLDPSRGIRNPFLRPDQMQPATAFLQKWNPPQIYLGPINDGRDTGDAPVTHAIAVDSSVKGSGLHILAASNLGVTRRYVEFVAGAEFWKTVTIVPGAPGEAPKKGASEVHVGKLKDGRYFLTTVEPWHGTDVAVYVSQSAEQGNRKLGPRMVIDTTLVDGHALWVADIDGDGDDEIFAGYRGGKAGVNMYRREGDAWTRTVVDDAIAAQDLRGGDLDGDGRPDVVAIGGKTHNLVWYRPIGRP